LTFVGGRRTLAPADEAVFCRVPARVSTFMKASKSIFAPIQIGWQELADLILPWRHSAYVRRHRAAVVISRVQILAAIFAVLIPLWIPVDMIAFPSAVWSRILPLRLAACLVFTVLAWPRKERDSRVTAVVMLSVMMLLPPAFHLLITPVLAGIEDVGFAGVVHDLYEFLPYTVVAGLSVFPLTALEAAFCWFVVFATMLGSYSVERFLDIHSLVGPVWLLFLIGGTAMVSGMSQLQYMIALVRRVTFDPLTGTLSRRAGLELMETHFQISLRNGVPFSIAFVDIDRFKQINDSFGHEIGDQVLRMSGHKLLRGLRQGEVVRWGGEEFLLLLAGADREGAGRVIERLGAGGLGERPDGQLVTASFGVAERLADKVDTITDLIELADRRMYDAKRAGRNRAVLGDGLVLDPVIFPTAGGR
jgi:diguanylate cyclase (GGDEF)-like protein